MHRLCLSKNGCEWCFLWETTGNRVLSKHILKNNNSYQKSSVFVWSLYILVVSNTGYEGFGQEPPVLALSNSMSRYACETNCIKPLWIQTGWSKSITLYPASLGENWKAKRSFWAQHLLSGRDLPKVAHALLLRNCISKARENKFCI